MVTDLAQYMWIITWALLFVRFANCDTNQNSGYKISTDNPCFKRYVVEPFFKGPGDSSASSLEEYIVHKVPFGSHAVVSVLLDLDRRLIGEGSHRRLSSVVKLSFQSDSPVNLSSQLCEFIFIERLPLGVFADPFELEHLLKRGVFKDASVFGDTNLELPSFLSNLSVVEVHQSADISELTEQEIIKDFKIEIPLHARYPPLDDSGYSNVKFGVPDFFIRCKMPQKSPVQKDQTCFVTPVATKGNLKFQDLVWRVPAGISTHTGFVSVGTFASAILAVIFIVLVSFRHASIESDARLKQS